VDRDVTERVAAEGERRKLEQRVQQAQKLEAVGFLAGGVAHDFNNMLQVVFSTVALARAKYPEESDLQAHLDDIEAAAQSAAMLTRQLLAFGRRQVLQPEPASPDNLIQGMLGLLHKLLAERVTLRLELGAEAVLVRADQGQFEQIITNLCVNARDAMPNGGDVVLKTETAELDAAFCAGRAEVTPGKYLALSVSDSGVGMSPETREHIFEPFFTTKKPGQGMGLGLSTVHGAVRQHGGSMDVVSAPGEGSTFRVYLPIVDEPDAAEDADQEPRLPGAETILIVEDEELVRGLAEQMLALAGYRILTAENAEQAFRATREHGNEIDLVLLDVVLPDASGPEIEDQLRELAPRAKVLFTTGYAASERDRRFHPERDFELLPKPYRHDELLRKVRMVLDGVTDDVAQ